MEKVRVLISNKSILNDENFVGEIFQENTFGSYSDAYITYLSSLLANYNYRHNERYKDETYSFQNLLEENGTKYERGIEYIWCEIQYVLSNDDEYHKIEKKLNIEGDQLQNLQNHRRSFHNSLKKFCTDE